MKLYNTLTNKKEEFTPIEAGKSVSFAEAEHTLVCRKMYMQSLDVERIPKEIAQVLYATDAPHDMYLGEVVEILPAKR